MQGCPIFSTSPTCFYLSVVAQSGAPALAAREASAAAAAACRSSAVSRPLCSDVAVAAAVAEPKNGAGLLASKTDRRGGGAALVALPKNGTDGAGSGDVAAAADDEDEDEDDEEEDEIALRLDRGGSGACVYISSAELLLPPPLVRVGLWLWANRRGRWAEEEGPRPEARDTRGRDAKAEESRAGPPGFGITPTSSAAEAAMA